MKPVPALVARLFVAAAVGALCAPATAADPAPTQGLIVRLKAAPAHEALDETVVTPRQRAAVAARAAAEAARWHQVLAAAGVGNGRLRPVGRDQQLVRFERPLSRDQAEEVSARLRAMPEVEWVEPNRRERRLQGPPTDPLYANQWWLQPVAGTNAQVLEARRRGVAGFQTAWARSGVLTAPTVVAVLDTGITAHDDLVGRALPGHDFVSGVEYANDGDGRDADPSDPGDYVSVADLANPAFDGCQAEDSSWHGTIVAGMVAAQANNGIGGAGIHGSARILPVRVAGKCGAEVADIVDGMRWAGGLAVAGVPANPTPARVVSISFGGSAACGPAYQAAVDELRAAGVVVVAAAGNEWGAPSRPANCVGVVGVVGLNRDGFKTNYSNFGSVLSASGIAAPSGDDADGAWGSVLADTGLTTLTNAGRTTPLGTNSHARLYGTSFAVPQVSGTVALMLALNPQLPYAQILDGLRKSARPHVTSPKIGPCADTNPGRCICTTATCGVGILDAEQALLYAAVPTTYVAPARQPEVIDNADVDAAIALAPQDRLSQVVVVPTAARSACRPCSGWAWPSPRCAGRAGSARRAASGGGRARGAGTARRAGCCAWRIGQTRRAARDARQFGRRCRLCQPEGRSGRRRSRTGGDDAHPLRRHLRGHPLRFALLRGGQHQQRRQPALGQREEAEVGQQQEQHQPAHRLSPPPGAR